MAMSSQQSRQEPLLVMAILFVAMPVSPVLMRKEDYAAH
jgi:hypothetical protein